MVCSDSRSWCLSSSCILLSIYCCVSSHPLELYSWGLHEACVGWFILPERIQIWCRQASPTWNCLKLISWCLHTLNIVWARSAQFNSSLCAGPRLCVLFSQVITGDQKTLLGQLSASIYSQLSGFTLLPCLKPLKITFSFQVSHVFRMVRSISCRIFGYFVTKFQDVRFTSLQEIEDLQCKISFNVVSCP